LGHLVVTRNRLPPPAWALLNEREIFRRSVVLFIEGVYVCVSVICVLGEVCIPLWRQKVGSVQWVLGRVLHVRFPRTPWFLGPAGSKGEKNICELEGSRGTLREAPDNYGVVWPQRKGLFD